MANTKITSGVIADDAVLTANITDANVTTAKIAADAVTSAKVADDAINSEHLAADSIDAEHYAAGSVDATAIASNAVTTAKINDDAVTTAKIADAQITTALMADDSVTSAKLDTNIAIAGTLGVASDVTLTSATTTKPHLIIKNTNADGGAPQLQFIKDSSSPADNDEIGRIYMYGDDDAGNPYEGVLIRGIATDVSNGSEDTTLEFFTQKAGSQASTLALASGNVGIGTASPARALSTKSSSVTIGNFESTSSSGGLVSFSDANTTDDVHVRVGAVGDNLVLQAGGAERMRIDSSGNVGIGNSNQTARLTIADSISTTYSTTGYAGTTSNSILYLRNDHGGSNTASLINFRTGTGDGVIGFVEGGGTNDADFVIQTDGGSNGVERMRITSGGVVLFGKSSTSVNTAGGYIDGGEAIFTIAGSGNTYLVRSTDTNAYTFYVGGDGEVHSAQGTAMTNLSDERLKENIVDIDTGLTEVLALKPRKFDWKDGQGSGKKNLSGFIAQEVEPILPDLIGDFLHDTLEDAKSLKTGDMIPTLVKAIQEQQVIIDDLKARIKTLEDA